MKIKYPISVRIVLISAALVSPSLPRATAQNQPLRVYASTGIKAVIQAFQLQCERTLGRPLAIELNSTAALKQKIQAGGDFDVVILTSDAIDELAKEGKVASGSVVTLARSGIGVGFRSGFPKPDISTSGKLKSALRKATSITFTKNGASRVYIERTLEGLGLLNEVRPKIVFPKGSESPTVSVAEGKVDLVITLISEILPTPGIELAGPLPPEFQSYVSFRGGIKAGTTQAAAAEALINLLRGAQAESIFRANGMEAR